MKTEISAAKNIETPFLKISGNCLEIQNTTIQLSNISLLSTADVTPAKFPVWSVALILIGIVLLEYFPVPAVLVTAVGGIWIYVWYSSVQEAKQMKRLTIVTNSGNAFPIVFSDQEFLSDVVTVMTDIIRDPVHAKEITVNVKDCTFENSSVIDNLYER